ncbi:hypothetical protein MHA02_35760 [Methylobacterium haplocladii]|uniref:Uncharacterized protein n=1 Tax=Methylobacterium haplocladii TaxID=1176176 RepID=A0A512IU73_9HYPH|nr:hypothetical protein MHA02_35760 [Methylobacterium haplocladii]
MESGFPKTSCGGTLPCRRRFRVEPTVAVPVVDPGMGEGPDRAPQQSAAFRNLEREETRQDLDLVVIFRSPSVDRM